jgi:hypothetical protein
MQPDPPKQQQRRARARAPKNKPQTLVAAQQPLASNMRLDMLASICQQVTAACALPARLVPIDSSSSSDMLWLCHASALATRCIHDNVFMLLLCCHFHTQALQLESMKEAMPGTAGPAMPDTPTPAELMG